MRVARPAIIKSDRQGTIRGMLAHCSPLELDYLKHRLEQLSPRRSPRLKKRKANEGLAIAIASADGTSFPMCVPTQSRIKELKTAIGQVRRPIKQFAVRSLSIAAAH